ncbi:MAG: hypothetical protein OHK006_03370 [Thermodesulfovibrionales bacterium]
MSEDMIKGIVKASVSDLQRSTMADEVREYAHVYALAKARQKGCDGMGELATVMEECREGVDKVIQYSQVKNISHDVSSDIDSIEDEIERV